MRESLFENIIELATRIVPIFIPGSEKYIELVDGAIALVQDTLDGSTLSVDQELEANEAIETLRALVTQKANNLSDQLRG